MKFVLINCLALCVIISITACNMKTAEESDDLDTDGMEQAMRQEFKKTHDPALNRIPSERLNFARQASISIMSLRTMALTWQERGPSNIGGRTRAIMIDRSDASGNTVFAGSVSGGIFKTTNFTSATPSWSPVNDKMTNLAVTALVQHKTNASIMYAGTGEGWFNIDGLRGAGVFKSTDGGATWNQLPSTASFEYIQDVEVDLNGNVYVSLRNASTTFRGVMRSIDGGNTWTQVLGLPLPNFTTGRAADLEVASNGDIYATLGIFGKTMVMKSSASVNGVNTGALNTWTEITPVHTTPTQRAEISIAPSNPLRLYLMMQDSATSQVKTLYRSSDGGVVWDSLPAPAALNNGSVSQTWYNLISAVDPVNPDIVVVGGYHVAKSVDGGTNFTDITIAGVHVDQHELKFNGSSNLIVGNDGGIYYTTNLNTSAPSFVNKNNGFNVTQFYGADYHPTNSNYFLAGAQDNNTQKFTAPGINATTPAVGGDGGIPHIDQTDGQIQIASTTGNNFYRSLDGGNTFSYMSAVSNNRGQFINATDYDDNLNCLYSGDDAGAYYYINNLQATPSGSSNTLSEIGPNREVTAVKVDPFNTATVWLGTNSLASGVIPEVMKVTSANSGAPVVTV
ncbi:MAG: WD40/YVTN/BNR-like repeat-containing protein, partial [Flavisolibacter sp.]